MVIGLLVDPVLCDDRLHSSFYTLTESRTAKCETERPASHEQLMEEVCERGNCWEAYKRVKTKKGSSGIRRQAIRQSSRAERTARRLCGETSTLSVFHDCLGLYRNLLNRRMPTRMSGGVAGCVKKMRKHHAVREMRAGPSEPSCRRGLQTAVSCFGQKLRW